MKIKFLPVTLLSALIAAASPVYAATYIGDAVGGLWSLEVATNTKTFIGNSGIGSFFDIALNPITGTLYGRTELGRLASISTTTGAATIIGSSSASINGLTFSSSGVLYGSGSNTLYGVDTATGATTLIGNTGFNSSGDIAFDANGNLFMSATGSNTDLLVSLNPLTGAGMLIGDLGYREVYGLNFENSTLYGFTSSGATIAINTGTGAGTFIATNGIRTNGADGSGGVVSVPDSGTTLSLFALALAGLRVLRPRKA